MRCPETAFAQQQHCQENRIGTVVRQSQQRILFVHCDNIIHINTIVALAAAQQSACIKYCRAEQYRCQYFTFYFHNIKLYRLKLITKITWQKYNFFFIQKYFYQKFQ